MAQYQTLKELELLPLPYPDLALLNTSHLPSRGFTPISQCQAAALKRLSDDQKEQRAFTASVDPTLIPDLLMALDEDISRCATISARYTKYRDNLKDGYEYLLQAHTNDSRLEQSSNVDETDPATPLRNAVPPSPLSAEAARTLNETIVDILAEEIVKHTSRTVSDFIPDCRVEHRNRPICGNLPGLRILPDATLSYPTSRSSSSFRLSTMINEDKLPLLLYSAGIELARRLKSVGSATLDYPNTIVSNQENWWLLLNKGAMYLTEVDIDGANTLAYFSCNSLIIMLQQRNESSPDHIFISDIEGNFRGNSLEQQFRSTVSDIGLQRARRLFPEPGCGYRPYPHIHDIYLGIALVTALAVNPSHVDRFPSLEAFRTQRRIPPPAIPSNSYDIHGRDPDDDLLDDDEPSQDSSQDSTYIPDRRASATFHQLHGYPSGPVNLNLCWGDHGFDGIKVSCLVPTLVGHDVIVQSEIRSSVDGYTYLASVPGLERKLVLKVFRFDVSAQAEFSAYMDLKDLQGSVIPVCYGYGYLSDQPWLLLEYINPPPSHISFSDLRQISRPHQGKIIHAVKLLHQLGYKHGELLDGNIIWTTDEDPVIIDLVGAKRHHCGSSCSEVETLRQYLGLTRRDAELWSLVVRPTRDQEAGMFVGGKPRSPQLAQGIEV
ncbi:hypothetical protein ARMGADRAFT_1008022 [Armillaria gallica]|uniref:Rhodanese domain-containing protein n=1 Tax=Armillaria gallica TaxID=47427 RepID=A0A2H3EK08_ARMGA|nr:hypothetical protein ARMGADRAFT_1008022 [Armillaria gallica]